MIFIGKESTKKLTRQSESCKVTKAPPLMATSCHSANTSRSFKLDTKPALKVKNDEAGKSGCLAYHLEAIPDITKSLKCSKY